MEDYSNLSERTNMFGVSLPGETRWHAEAWAEAPLGADGLAETAHVKAKKPVPGDRGSIGALLKVSGGDVTGIAGSGAHMTHLPDLRHQACREDRCLRPH